MNNEVITNLVKKQLSEEIKKVTGNKEKAMAGYIKGRLIDFSEQNSEFAQAITESGKTFAECMKTVAKGTGSSISDLEACRKAVAFYFPGADIKFNMTINLCASVGGDDSGSAMIFSLEDFM